MAIPVNYVVGAMVVGVGATALMDLWNLFLRRAFGIRSLDYCLLGRWVTYVLEGRMRHASIAAAPPRSRECTIGWMAHYSIGVVLAMVFVLGGAGSWLAHPTLLPALLFGLGTVLLPFFVMQPSFGLGVAASRTPNPTQARLKSLATHTVFGLAMYMCAVAVSPLLQSAG